jgi:flagellar biosynthetic protein FliQ
MIASDKFRSSPKFPIRYLACPRTAAWSFTMNANQAVDITREAILIALVISAPVLVVGLISGLLVGLLQALTQVQDQTVAFVPKLVAMIAALTLSLPWLLQKLVEYSHDLIANIPRTISGG